MQTKTEDKQMRDYNRQMLRGAFRSLFWVMFSERKRTEKFTLQAFADKLGIGKSSLSRGFNEPQNWTIDKMADMAHVLGVELVVEARNVETGAIYTPTGAGNYAKMGATKTSIPRNPIISSCGGATTIAVGAGKDGATIRIISANAV
jgi:hypothetical protein